MAHQANQSSLATMEGTLIVKLQISDLKVSYSRGLFSEKIQLLYLGMAGIKRSLDLLQQ